MSRARDGPVPGTDARVAITKVTDEMASPQDTDRPPKCSTDAPAFSTPISRSRSRRRLSAHPLEKLRRKAGLAFEFGGDRRWYALVGAIEPTAVLHCAPTAAVVVEQHDAGGIRVRDGPHVNQGLRPIAGAQHL